MKILDPSKLVLKLRIFPTLAVEDHDISPL